MCTGTLSEEASIERILFSLALKTTTQSVIVGKLSAHRRKHRTKRALWEFDSNIRTLYLLDYIDSPALRRNVQEALGELEQRGDLASAEVLKHVSPVAGQHINFYGRYRFDEDFSPIDLERLRQHLSAEEISRLYAAAA